MDSAKLYAEAIAPLLAPGERLLSATMVTYFAGEERVGEEPGGIDFDPLLGLVVPAWEAAMQRALTGVSLMGRPGSLAHRLLDAMSWGNHIVVTDARILVADLGDTGSLAWEAPRSIVVHAAVTPRLLQRGRVTLGFSDGSVLRVMAGMFFAKQARSMVAALTGS